MIKYITMNQHIVYNITRPANILGLRNDKLVYYSGCCKMANAALCVLHCFSNRDAFQES